MISNSRIRAAVFDMDGVLTDSEPLINAAAIAMFFEKGLRVQPEDFLPFVGLGQIALHRRPIAITQSRLAVFQRLRDAVDPHGHRRGG